MALVAEWRLRVLTGCRFGSIRVHLLKLLLGLTLSLLKSFSEHLSIGIAPLFLAQGLYELLVVTVAILNSSAIPALSRGLLRESRGYG